MANPAMMLNLSDSDGSAEEDQGIIRGLPLKWRRGKGGCHGAVFVCVGWCGRVVGGRFRNDMCGRDWMGVVGTAMPHASPMHTHLCAFTHRSPPPLPFPFPAAAEIGNRFTHPNSDLRRMWNFVVFIAVVYNSMTVPGRYAFNNINYWGDTGGDNPFWVRHPLPWGEGGTGAGGRGGERKAGLWSCAVWAWTSSFGWRASLRMECAGDDLLGWIPM